MNNLIISHIAVGTATFVGGLGFGLLSVFGFKFPAPHPAKVPQPNQAQVRQLQAQNKQLCQYFTLHKIKPPHGVVCR